MMENESCNTCKYFEPFGCFCEKDGHEHKPLSPACEDWVDWEEVDER